MFKKVLYSHSPLLVSAAALILRLAYGLMMMRYGYRKLVNFDQYSDRFMDFLGMGPAFSLGLAVFAELFCAGLVVIGLLTRLALVPLIITMLVAFFIAHAGDPFDTKEHPLVFLFAYLALMATGPGRFSADRLIFNR